MVRIAQQSIERPTVFPVAPSARAIGAVAVFILSLTMFAATLPSLHSGDDLQYAMVITGTVDGVLFYHPAGIGLAADSDATTDPDSAPDSIPINPRYLLEWPTSMVVYRMWKMAGWTEDALIPVQMFRALAGAAGATLLFFFLTTVTTGVRTALLASIGAVTSSSYWTYSTTVDQSINFVVLLIAALLLVSLRLRRGVPSWLDYAIPAVLGIATLYNFTAVIGASVVGLLLIQRAYAGSASIREPLRVAALFGLVYSLTIVVPIAGAIVWQDGAANLVDGNYWRRITFAGHPEYGLDPVRDALRSALSLGKAQIAYPPAPGSLQDYWEASGSREHASLLAFYGVVLAIMAAPVLALLALSRSRLRHPMSVLVLVCMLSYATFSFWWDPGYIKYWIVPVVCWWALVAFVLDAARDLSMRWHTVGSIAIAAFVVATVLVNVVADRSTTPDAAGDWRAAARSLQSSATEDLFVSLDGHPLDFYIAYLTRRDIVSLRLIQYSAGGDEALAYEKVNDRIYDHLEAGGSIYVYAQERVTTGRRNEILERLRLTPANPEWEFQNLVVFRAIRE